MTVNIGAWGSVVNAAMGLATAIAYKPYYPVSEPETFEYSVPTIPDNSVAVYNNAYQKVVQRNNALELQYKGERSIAAAKMKGVRERTTIGITQDIAEAEARMNAAFSGRTGGSVDSLIYQTQADAAFRIADQAISEQNSIEKALEDVYRGSQGSNVLQDDYKVHSTFVDPGSFTGESTGIGENFSWAGAIMGAIGSNFNRDFFTDLGLTLEQSEVPEIQAGQEPYNRGLGL